MDRKSMVRRLAAESFDLLVVGGGITGAGVAREAALRGLRVGLVEAQDFASATSSSSTKLIHGGLRYLKNFEFRLVAEAVAERQRLLRMAPHLVKATPFLFPVYEGDPDALFTLNMGLTLYDWFAGGTNPIPHRMHRPANVLALEPGLRSAGLKGGAVYADSLTDDGRLTLEVVQSAASHGAALANYLRVTRFLKDGQGHINGAAVADQLTGDTYEVRAARVLAAAGPWADAVRRLDDPNAPGILRLTKGVHLTLPADRLPLQDAVVIRGKDGRMMFAVPSYPCTYVGTTDTDWNGDPRRLTIDRSDVEYILEAAARTFPAAGISENDVIGAWVGVRPLLKPPGDKKPSATSRDYAIFHSPSGLVSIGGGKLTAFRAMASHVVDGLFPATRGSSHREKSIGPLPGAEGPQPTRADLTGLAAATQIPLEYAEFLASRYGSALPRVAAALPGAAEPSQAPAAEPSQAPAADPARRWLRARTQYAVEREMAVTLLDIIRRRTELMLFTPGNGLHHLAALAAEMAPLLGWSAQRQEEEVERCRNTIQDMFAWREPS